MCTADLSMLGCLRRFISCTSFSMLALLLAMVFIFRAITCPVVRCCTFRERERENTCVTDRHSRGLFMSGPAGQRSLALFSLIHAHTQPSDSSQTSKSLAAGDIICTQADTQCIYVENVEFKSKKQQLSYMKHLKTYLRFCTICTSLIKYRQIY